MHGSETKETQTKRFEHLFPLGRPGGDGAEGKETLETSGTTCGTNLADKSWHYASLLVPQKCHEWNTNGTAADTNKMVGRAKGTRMETWIRENHNVGCLLKFCG